jgi:DNA-binding NarL/FixJ family response regulator
MIDGPSELPSGRFGASQRQAAPVAANQSRFIGHPSEPTDERRIVVSGPSVTIVEALGAALAGRPGLQVVATALTEAGLFELVSRHRPDGVVVYLPQLDAETVGVVDRLKVPDQVLRVVLLAGRSTIQALAYAAEAGVAACLSLNAGLRDLAEAIRTDTSDTMLVDATSLSAPAEARFAEVPQNSGISLTRRELEVLMMMAEGYSPPTIAAELTISIYTARGHVKRVLRKLGAHSQLEAVVRARDLNLLGSVALTSGQKRPPRAGRGRLTSVVTRHEGQLLGWRRNA